MCTIKKKMSKETFKKIKQKKKMYQCVPKKKRCPKRLKNNKQTKIKDVPKCTKKKKWYQSVPKKKIPKKLSKFTTMFKICIFYFWTWIILLKGILYTSLFPQFKICLYTFVLFNFQFFFHVNILPSIPITTFF
jgi:hypothetical protein